MAKHSTSVVLLFGCMVLSRVAPVRLIYRRIYHRCRLSSIVTGTDADIFHAIQQYDHIRHVALKPCLPTMDKLIVPMNEPFPILDSSHSPTTVSETNTELTIPATFLPPVLYHITSHHTVLIFQQNHQFSPPAFPFVTLKLTDIQRTEYFTPDDLVTQLQHIRQLQELSIDFSIPLSRPGDEGGLLRGPSTCINAYGPSLSQAARILRRGCLLGKPSL